MKRLRKNRKRAYYRKPMMQWKVNPHLKNLQKDVLYHFGLDTTMDLQKMFGDVQVVCMMGSPVRAENFARITAKSLFLDSSVEAIGKTERFSLYKTGPIISVSHGMGMPSILIMLHEITKLLHYAGCENTEYIRIGTSGGVGVKLGTVVISEEALNANLEPWYEEVVLGQMQRTPTQFDQRLVDALLKSAGDIPVVTGKTMSVDDFYEQQGRLDGALIPSFGHVEQEEYVRMLYQSGVRNIEMETSAMAAFCHRAGIRATAVCATVVERFYGDQVECSPEELDLFSRRAQNVVVKYLTFLLPFTVAVALAACSPTSQQSTIPPEQQPQTVEKNARIIQVTSENWKFSPNVIMVKKGEKVQLQVTGVSGTHGFTVPGIGINVPVAPGQTVMIDVPTDDVGAHNLFCSIPCGSGHKDMKGQIVIEE